MSHDQKVMLLQTMEVFPMDLYQGVFFLLPNFDNSSPSVTRDKQICQIHVIMM